MPTLWMAVGNPAVRAVSNSKIFEGTHQAKLEFLEGLVGGGGSNQKKITSFLWEEVWIFSGTSENILI